MIIITKKTDKCKQRLNSAQHNYYKKAEKTGMVEYKQINYEKLQL